MSPLVMDWDGRLIPIELGVKICAETMSEFLGLTGRFNKVRHVNFNALDLRHLSTPGYTITPDKFGPETVLEIGHSFIMTYTWFYVPPEECQVRADHAYKSLKMSGSLADLITVSLYIDVLSLGSILNGAVI